MTVCPIVSLDAKNGRLEPAAIDALDGTAVLDVKPYYGCCDRVKVPKTPSWLPPWGDWVPEEGNRFWRRERGTEWRRTGEIVEEVARMIEGRWAEDLSVPTLAAKAGYSLHHFGRLFAGVVGLPPKEYVLRRRLSEAARDLSRDKRRVTDVAFDYGFNDLETFTRAFRRVLGVTPSAVRRGAAFPYFAGAVAEKAAVDPRRFARIGDSS